MIRSSIRLNCPTEVFLLHLGLLLYAVFRPVLWHPVLIIAAIVIYILVFINSYLLTRSGSLAVENSDAYFVHLQERIHTLFKRCTICVFAPIVIYLVGNLLIRFVDSDFVWNIGFVSINLAGLILLWAAPVTLGFLVALFVQDKNRSLFVQKNQSK